MSGVGDIGSSKPQGTGPLPDTVALPTVDTKTQAPAPSSLQIHDHSQTQKLGTADLAPTKVDFSNKVPAGPPPMQAAPPQAPSSQQLELLSTQLKGLQDKLAQLEQQGAPGPQLNEIKEYLETVQDRLATLKDGADPKAVIDKANEDLDAVWFAVEDLSRMKGADQKPVVDPTTIKELKSMVDEVQLVTLDKLEKDLRPTEGLTREELQQIKENLQIVYDLNPDAPLSTPEGRKRALAANKLQELGVKVVVNKMFGVDALAPDDYIFEKEGVRHSFKTKGGLEEFLDKQVKPDRPASGHEAPAPHDADPHHDPKAIEKLKNSALRWERVDGWLHQLEHTLNATDPQGQQQKAQALAELQQLGISVKTEGGKTLYSYTDHTGNIATYTDVEEVAAAVRVSTSQQDLMPTFGPNDTIEQKITKLKEQVTKNEAIIEDLHQKIKQIDADLDDYVAKYDKRVSLISELQKPAPPATVRAGFFSVPNPEFVAWQVSRQKTIQALGELGVQVKQENGKEVYLAQTGPTSFEKFGSIQDLRQFLNARYTENLDKSYSKRAELGNYVETYYSPCNQQVKAMLENYKDAKEGGAACTRALARMGVEPGKPGVKGVFAETADGATKYFVADVTGKKQHISAEEALLRVAEASARDSVANTAMTAPEKARQFKVESHFLAGHHERITLTAGTLERVTRAKDKNNPQRGVFDVLRDVKNGTITPTEAARQFRNFAPPVTIDGSTVTVDGIPFTFNQQSGLVTFDTELGKRYFHIRDQEQDTNKQILAEVDRLNKEGADVLQRIQRVGQASQGHADRHAEDPEVQSNNSDVQTNVHTVTIENMRLGRILENILVNSGMPRDTAKQFLADDNPDISAYAAQMDEGSPTAATVQGEGEAGGSPARADYQAAAAEPAAEPAAPQPTDREGRARARDFFGSLFNQVFNRQVSTGADTVAEGERAAAKQQQQRMDRRSDAARAAEEKLKREKLVEEELIEELRDQKDYELQGLSGRRLKTLAETMREDVTGAPGDKDKDK